MADAIEDARRIRLRIDALADAAAELVREVRRDADRLTADLGFEPELLTGVVQLESGPERDDERANAADAGATTAAADIVPEPDEGEEEAPAQATVEHATADDLTLDEEPADEAAGASGTPEPEPLDSDEDEDEDEDESPAEQASTAEEVPEPDRPESEAAEADKTHASVAEVDDAVVVEEDEGTKSPEGDQVPCKACDTTGQCSNCKGRGRRFRFLRCGECGGSGRCSVCGGPGFV